VRLPNTLLIILRVLGMTLILLGITFWTGHLYGLVPVHRAGGVLFVLTLWTIAALALARRHKPALAGVVIAWGLGVAALGFAQQFILPGDYHWIVRVTHLAVAVASMPMAQRLAQTGQPG
jgi:hypothetical protein